MGRMSLTSAASMVEGIIHQNWRFYIGRSYPEALESVSGVSLTWSGTDTRWKFTLSVRKDGEWHKFDSVYHLVEIEDPFDDDTPNDVRELAHGLLASMFEHAFPDEWAEDQRRKKKEEDEDA